MRASARLLQSCRITLFTRENCGLCTRAKSALSNVWDSRPFVYKEVDIVKPGAQAWRDLYDFDVPVVSLLFFLRSTCTDTHRESSHLR